jgi:hypothetical protein
MSASVWVIKPERVMKVKSWDPSRGHRRPNQTFCDGFEVEHTCWDPKDGELCLHRVKPEETLVEARSDSDVQIDRRMWV